MTYADGTSGHQGDSSEQAEPSRRAIQGRVLNLVWRSQSRGITMREACSALDREHQSVSSALSNLHMDGTIVRLRAQRDRCGVYVVNDDALIRGRETVAHRSHAHRMRPMARETIEQVVDDWQFSSGRRALVDAITALVVEHGGRVE